MRVVRHRCAHDKTRLNVCARMRETHGERDTTRACAEVQRRVCMRVRDVRTTHEYTCHTMPKRMNCTRVNVNGDARSERVSDTSTRARFALATRFASNSEKKFKKVFRHHFAACVGLA